MRKVLLILIVQVLCFKVFADTKNTTAAAVKQSKNNAQAVVWSVAGISLLITIGVITAIVIQNEN